MLKWWEGDKLKKNFSSEEMKGLGDMWLMDMRYHCDVYAVIQDIHNESIDQPINKHLSSADYDINISLED